MQVIPAGFGNPGGTCLVREDNVDATINFSTDSVDACRSLIGQYATALGTTCP